MELLPGIHRVDRVASNVYLIVEPAGLTLIDTGMPGSASHVTRYIASLGRDPRDLRRIVLTHQHVDHIGNLADLAHASGAEVLAHPADAPAIQGQAPYELPRLAPLRWLMRAAFLRRLKPAHVTTLVRNGDTIPVLTDDGGLRVIATPGHTPGHIALYLPGRQVLFAGDAYRHRGAAVMPPPSFLNSDTLQALRSMASLTQLSFEVSLPGHGKPLLHGGRDAVLRAVPRP